MSAPEHPAPWRWMRQGRSSLLMDAANKCVLSLDDDERGQQSKSLRTPMEVIRSAREMLDLLRGLVDSYQGAVITTNRGADLEDISAAEEAFSRAGLLVARIDAAKAGT